MLQVKGVVMHIKDSVDSCMSGCEDDDGDDIDMKKYDDDFVQ